MNRHFFKDKAKAIRALLRKPCEWDGCGEQSSFYTVDKNTAALKPLCTIHATTAGRFGYDVRMIPQIPQPTHDVETQPDIM